MTDSRTGNFDDMHGVVNDAYTGWDEGDASREETHRLMADVALHFLGGPEALVDLVASLLSEGGLPTDTGSLSADQMADVCERLKARLAG